LQRALEETSRTRTPLALGPGVYRVGNIRLPGGAQILGVRGATRLTLGESTSLLIGEGADEIVLTGLVFEGIRRRLPEGRGLLHLERARAIKISDCEFANAGGSAMRFVAVSGAVMDCAITNCVSFALHSLDAVAGGLLIARNTISGAGDNGIAVWRSSAGEDGTIIADNRIDKVENRSGGSGQYGNAVNVFRAGNVIVRGNRIADCAFTAVRGRRDPLAPTRTMAPASGSPWRPTLR
jgi:uncharacterized secreted repeat protein (TIGR03808 family)